MRTDDYMSCTHVGIHLTVVAHLTAVALILNSWWSKSQPPDVCVIEQKV
jgi:hypothetical protein